MNRATFFNHFELLADQPDAVAKMREVVLELAVRGKLIPQNPTDEPAKAKFGRNEELNANAPFEIPEKWTWTQLSQLADINGGFAFKSTDYTEEGTRVIRISDFDEFGFKDHKVVRHPFSPDLQKFMLAENNILMAMTGGTVGKSYFVKSLPEPMVVNQRVATIKVSAAANPSYVDIAIRSEMTQEVIRKAKNSTNDNISMGDMKGFTIPLPPLADQRRIVAKVDELMALCDELEQRQQARQHASGLLQQSALHHLLAAREPQTFAAAWQRVRDHFHLLHDTPDAIPQLRQAILQLAIQGRLKTQSGEGGFPQVCLDGLGDWALGCGFPTAEQGHTDRPILFAKVSDMNLDGNELEILKTNHTIDEATAKRLRVKVHPPGTVIFPKIGGAIATNKRRIIVKPTAIDNNCLGIVPNKSCSTAWLFLVLSAIDFAKYQSGTSVPALNQGTIGGIEVSLPPPTEQKQIVARVEELLRWCDTLEAQLHQTRTLGAHLLASTLHHLLAA